MAEDSKIAPLCSKKKKKKPRDKTKVTGVEKTLNYMNTTSFSRNARERREKGVDR